RSGRAPARAQPRRDRARSARGGRRGAPAGGSAAARSRHAHQGKDQGAPVRPLLLLLLCTAACALLGKNDPNVPRYFTPEYEGDGAAGQLRSDLQLRLGRVEGWSHVRERLAVRNSARELFYYEDR